MSESELVERLRGLVATWREEASKWRADDETPYACEWADTQEECADALDALLSEIRETPQDRPEPIAKAAGDRLEPMRRDLAKLLDTLYGLHLRPGHVEAVLDVVQLHSPQRITKSRRAAGRINAGLLGSTASDLVRRHTPRREDRDERQPGNRGAAIG